MFQVENCGDVSSLIQSRALDGVECSNWRANGLNNFPRSTLRQWRGGSLSLSGSFNREDILSAAGIGIYLFPCQPVT